MDAIDSLLDAFRSNAEHGKRNRRVVLLGLLSAVAAWACHHITLGDVDTTAWQGEDSPDWAGGSVLVFVIAPFAVYLAVRKKESVIRYALGALLAPTLALAVGLLNADNRSAQQEAFRVFDAYTHRFPRGFLHDEYALDQVGNYVTICAEQGIANPNRASDGTRFCVEMIVGDDRGQKVQGGYRYDAFDGGGIEPFGCFGDPVRCPSDQDR